MIEHFLAFCGAVALTVIVVFVLVVGLAAQVLGQSGGTVDRRRHIAPFPDPETPVRDSRKTATGGRSAPIGWDPRISKPPLGQINDLREHFERLGFLKNIPLDWPLPDKNPKKLTTRFQGGKELRR
jgi:hypothetical protein